MNCIKDLLSAIALMIFAIACFLIMNSTLFNVLGIVAIVAGLIFLIAGLYDNLKDR